MELTQEFFYRVKTTGSLKTTKGSPLGERNYWIVSDAEIDGPRIMARIAAPGSDWMGVADDGFWRPDVRVPFKPTTVRHRIRRLPSNVRADGCDASHRDGAPLGAE